MKLMSPPGTCLQMSVSYYLATVVPFLGEFCHHNLPTECWIRWSLYLFGLGYQLQMWWLGWHKHTALPQGSSAHRLAVR